MFIFAAMIVVLSALLPVLVLIAIGYALGQLGFPGPTFWRPAARMVYFVFLPALLVHVVALAELDPNLWKAQVAAALAVLLLTAALWLTRGRLFPDGPGFTSVVQGSVRHNTYIGLAIGNAMFSPSGVAAFVLIAAVIVPLVNAVSVANLARYGNHEHEVEGLSAARTVRLVALNPLILACALGTVLNLTDIGLPWGSAEVFRMLGQPALTIGLLVVGAGLRAGALREFSLPILLPVVVRLLLYPALAVGCAHLLGLAPEHLAPLALLAALPTAASAYVLALELGGDEDLMARIITVETVAAAVTIPLVLGLVSS